MRPFTDEEFETMISELTDEIHPTFDMLCTIADKTLRNKIKFWCATDSVLRGREMEDDIMQDVFIRLIKTTTYGFLIRKDRNGVLNRDPGGFQSWMFTVAENIKNDTARALRRRDYRIRGMEDDEENRIPDNRGEDDEEEEDRRERLARAFRIVFDSDKEVYIILTWLAQNLFVLESDITKIQSIQWMTVALSEKTLYELRDIVLKFAQNVDWIVISGEQLEKMNRALGAVYNGEALGNYKYKDFYMKKGGKKSISDWVYRVNCMIKQVM